MSDYFILNIKDRLETGDVKNIKAFLENDSLYDSAEYGSTKN